MAANKADGANGDGAAAASAGNGARANPSGGFSAWLPLIVTILVMPVLAWATTTFLIVPKLQKSLGMTPAAGDSKDAPAADAHGKGESSAAATTEMVTMNKLLVNVSGTLGSR